ncbi:hypothetical protein [Carboxylicivirga sp. RSCT41]|uniref:hypothetical protein n=1 Tax=Carboxylicivirga agarovorans TaxID=3417570 RepID=UPI003D33D179
MKLKLILFFFIFLSFNPSFGQDSNSTQEIDRYNLKNKSNDQRVRQFLTMNKQLIAFRCHPFVAPEIQDSLKQFYGIIDSIRITNDYKTDSTIVCIKKSYCWEIDNDLPQISNYKMLKKLIKNKSKLTNDEKKLLEYWAFYSKPQNARIEKFIHYQSFTDTEKHMQVEYEITFDADLKYKVNIKKIKTTANTPL